MTTILDFQVIEGTPGTASVSAAVLQDLRLHDPPWFERQSVAASPELGGVEGLLDAFAAHDIAKLGFVWEMAWETMEWEDVPRPSFTLQPVFSSWSGSRCGAPTRRVQPRPGMRAGVARAATIRSISPSTPKRRRPSHYLPRAQRGAR